MDFTISPPPPELSMSVSDLYISWLPGQLMYVRSSTIFVKHELFNFISIKVEEIKAKMIIYQSLIN